MTEADESFWRGVAVAKLEAVLQAQEKTAAALDSVRGSIGKVSSDLAAVKAQSRIIGALYGAISGFLAAAIPLAVAIMRFWQ